MIITLATSQNPLKKVVGSLMGLNCPKLIVIVSETLKDLDKEDQDKVLIAVHYCHKNIEGF
jgi:hypothetical protein